MSRRLGRSGLSAEETVPARRCRGGAGGTRAGWSIRPRRSVVVRVGDEARGPLPTDLPPGREMVVTRQDTGRVKRVSEWRTADGFTISVTLVIIAKRPCDSIANR